MTDLTDVLHELRAAYRAYQNAKRDHKERIREKYEAVIAEEVRKAVEGEKYIFSSLLRDRKEEYGLKVTEIQDHVLRTRNWKMWEELRDYADIQPEQILRTNARAEREAKEAVEYEWNADHTVLSWLKDKNGKNLSQPVRIDHDEFRGAKIVEADREFARASGSFNYIHTEAVRVWDEYLTGRDEQ